MSRERRQHLRRVGFVRTGDGRAVTFARVEFHTKVSTDSGLELSIDEDASCARVDECGTVHTPVTLTARTTDNVSHRVRYGAPIVDSAKDDTWYVLGGSAAPISPMSCSRARRTAWVARVEPAK